MSNDGAANHTPNLIARKAHRRKGRPTGRENNATIVRKYAKKKHSVRDRGKIRRITTFELAVRKLRERAAKGDLRAIDYLDRWRTASTHNEFAGGVFLAPEIASEEEWERQMAIIDRVDKEVAKRLLARPTE